MTTADIIRRKASFLRQQVIAGTPGADRAFRFGLAKGALQALKIQLEVQKLSIDRRSAAELVEIVPDFALIALLDGPALEMGAMILSQSVVAGFIEAQTIGRVRGHDLMPRKPTRTDGAMVMGVIDAVLAILEQSLIDNPDIVWAGGFRCASFLEDPRPLPVVLEDAPLRLLTADVSLAAGVRSGKIYLALPAEGHLPHPKAQSDGESEDLVLAFAAALQDRVDGASVYLDAILARLLLPMADVLAMEEGMVVPLREARLDEISLEGTDGRCVAFGKLGQNRGMRALRVEDVQADFLRKPALASRVLALPYPALPVANGAQSAHSPWGRAGTADISGPSTARLDDVAQGHGPGKEIRPVHQLRTTGTD